MGRFAQAARRPDVDMRQQRRGSRLVQREVVQLQFERHRYRTRFTQSFAVGEFVRFESEEIVIKPTVLFYSLVF